MIFSKAKRARAGNGKPGRVRTRPDRPARCVRLRPRLRDLAPPLRHRSCDPNRANPPPLSEYGPWGRGLGTRFSFRLCVTLRRTCSYPLSKKQLLLLVLLGISGSLDGFVLHLTEKRLPKASRRRGIPVVPMRPCPRVRVVHLRKIEHSALMISDNSGHAETYRVLTMVRKEGAPP